VLADPAPGAQPGVHSVLAPMKPEKVVLWLLWVTSGRASPATPVRKHWRTRCSQQQRIPNKKPKKRERHNYENENPAHQHNRHNAAIELDNAGSFGVGARRRRPRCDRVQPAPPTLSWLWCQKNRLYCIWPRLGPVLMMEQAWDFNLSGRVGRRRGSINT
jgi:hypothetical protein